MSSLTDHPMPNSNQMIDNSTPIATPSPTPSPTEAPINFPHHHRIYSRSVSQFRIMGGQSLNAETGLERRIPQLIDINPQNFSGYSFKASDANSGAANSQPTLIEQRLPNIQAYIDHAHIDQNSYNFQDRSVVIYCQNNNQKNEEEDVSEEFVNQFNNHIGNAENHNIAQRLMKKMRLLGGLESGSLDQRIDIPQARLGLCILAGLPHPYKMEALDNLYDLLKRDNLEKDSAIQLVSLAIKLMKNMNRELMQTEVVDFQIKIAEVYNALTHLLQYHYAKQHINAITKELKLQLSETAKALQDLNRQENPKLSFYVNCALEGIRNLKDDSKVLFDIFERIYHITAALTSLQMSQAEYGFGELDKVFKDIDPHLKSEWYSGVLLLNDLTKKVLSTEDLDKQTAERLQSNAHWKDLHIKLSEFLNEKGLELFKKPNGLVLLGRNNTGLLLRNEDKKSVREVTEQLLHIQNTIREAIHTKKLMAIQILVKDERKNYKNKNWKFSYAALETFSNIVLNGQTPKIRLNAFNGIKQLGLDFPGLATFADIYDLPSYTTYKPMIHLEIPREQDPNKRVRRACAEHLIHIASHSQDKIIRSKARFILTQRLNLEEDKQILEIISAAIPENDQTKKIWLQG